MTAAYVTPDEWRGWLRQHDITPGTLQELTVVPEGLFDRDTGGSRDAVLMRCLHLVTDASGCPMVGEDGDVVRVTVWRPMRRLPGEVTE